MSNLKIEIKIRVNIMGRDYNVMQAFDVSGKTDFRRFHYFWRNWSGLYTLGPHVIWFCYYMKFRSNSFGMIELSLCIIFVPVYFLVLTQKLKQTFKFCNGTSTWITDVAELLLHFLLWKVSNRLKLNLCKCSFSPWIDGFFNWFKLI